MQKNGLIRKLWQKFMTQKIKQEKVAIHILSTISRNKGSKIMKFEIWSVINIQSEEYFNSNIIQKNRLGD